MQITLDTQVKTVLKGQFVHFSFCKTSIARVFFFTADFFKSRLETLHNLPNNAIANLEFQFTMGKICFLFLLLLPLLLLSVLRKTRPNVDAFLFTLWPKQKSESRAVINQSGVRSTSFAREDVRTLNNERFFQWTDLRRLSQPVSQRREILLPGNTIIFS